VLADRQRAIELGVEPRRLRSTSYRFHVALTRYFLQVRQAKLSSDVCEFVLVHVAPVGSEAPQRTEAPFGEVGSRQGSIGPDLHQATINHRPQRRWQFGLSGQRATAPCSQLKAVSH
jgi:hypothetical protein